MSEGSCGTRRVKGRENRGIGGTSYFESHHPYCGKGMKS